jgi:hypothetical protein
MCGTSTCAYHKAGLDIRGLELWGSGTTMLLWHLFFLYCMRKRIICYLEGFVVFYLSTGVGGNQHMTNVFASVKSTLTSFFN